MNIFLGLLSLTVFRKIQEQPGYGSSIPDSRYYRSFCPGCMAPTRVTKAVLEIYSAVYCIECEPSHQGCSSPVTGLDSVDRDVDAYQPSWKNR